MDNVPTSHKKWYQKSFGIVVLLILFFPVGLYMMWKHATWNKAVKWIITAVFAIGVISNIGGSKNASTSTTGSQTSTPTVSQATSAPTQAPEAQKVTATEIADAFDANAVSAEATWKGKFVEFSAVVGNITNSGLSFTDIGSKLFSLTQISCRIKDKQQLLSLKNGETTTVRGIIGGQTIGVIIMTDCEVVK